MPRRQDNPLECGPISSASRRARSNRRWTAIIVPPLPGVASPHDTTSGECQRSADAHCPFRRHTAMTYPSLRSKASSPACVSSPRGREGFAFPIRPVRDRQHDQSEIVCMTGPTSSTRRYHGTSSLYLSIPYAPLRFARCRVAASSVGGCCVRGFPPRSRRWSAARYPPDAAPA